MNESSNACYKVELCGPEEVSAARAKSFKKSAAVIPGRRAFGLFGDRIEIAGFIARGWAEAIKSRSNANIVRQLVLRNNTKGITADVHPAAPTTPIETLNVNNIEATGHATVVEVVNTVAPVIDTMKAVDNDTAVSFLQPIRNIEVRPIPFVNNVVFTKEQCPAFPDCPAQISTGVEATVTNATIDAPVAVDLVVAPVPTATPAVNFADSILTKGRFQLHPLV